MMNNNRILIVDDNDEIHNDFKKALYWEKQFNTELEELEKSLKGITTEKLEFPVYEIDSAFQGEEALNMVRIAIAEDRPYALAFVDIRMPPGWDGIETIEAIWKIDPNIQTVICTAHSDYSWEEIFSRLGHSDRLLILKKPFDLVEIRLATLALTKKWLLNQKAQIKMDELQDMVKQQTEKLALQLSLTEATIESTADGIVVVDNQKKVIQYNSKFMKIWNISKEKMIQGNLLQINEIIRDQVAFPEDVSIIPKEQDSHLIFGKYREVHLKSNKYIEQYIQPQYFNHKIVGYVYSFRDITQRKNLETELAKQSSYDNLTGLPNRILLVDRIQMAIFYAKRNHSNLALLFIDLDSFKLVNDSFGHQVGDELLKIFAQRLRNCIRQTDKVFQLAEDIVGDTAARLGGDEFIVVLTTKAKTKEELIPAVNRLNEILTQPYHLAGHELIVTFSTGISFYPSDGEDPITLIKNSDYAMYRAKEQKKGSFEFYTKDMDDKSLVRLELENDLRQALSKNEFFLYYQPLFDVEKKKLVSLEVLLRWKHERHGLIAPSTFIPIAESTGMIIPIGLWLLRYACLQNKAWQDQGLMSVPISVNLSGVQFKQKTIVEEIKKILDETKLDPKFLELELTENIVMRDPKDVTQKILQLKQLGVNINIDDFGTGYSSLSYINQFPVDKIKIDQSFIGKLATNPESLTIVQAILMIAKSLNMSVVAEGVETESQLDILKSISADIVQGYFLSYPLSADDAKKFLEKNFDFTLPFSKQ